MRRRFLSPIFFERDDRLRRVAAFLAPQPEMIPERPTEKRATVASALLQFRQYVTDEVVETLGDDGEAQDEPVSGA
jgi:hypothetical protein